MDNTQSDFVVSVKYSDGTSREFNISDYDETRDFLYLLKAAVNEGKVAMMYKDQVFSIVGFSDAQIVAGEIPPPDNRPKPYKLYAGRPNGTISYYMLPFTSFATVQEAQDYYMENRAKKAWTWAIIDFGSDRVCSIQDGSFENPSGEWVYPEKDKRE